MWWQCNSWKPEPFWWNCTCWRTSAIYITGTWRSLDICVVGCVIYCSIQSVIVDSSSIRALLVELQISLKCMSVLLWNEAKVCRFDFYDLFSASNVMFLYYFACESWNFVRVRSFPYSSCSPSMAARSTESEIRKKYANTLFAGMYVNTSVVLNQCVFNWVAKDFSLNQKPNIHYFWKPNSNKQILWIVEMKFLK